VAVFERASAEVGLVRRGLGWTSAMVKAGGGVVVWAEAARERQAIAAEVRSIRNICKRLG